MVKPNWDKFKAKFSENPQDNFEWFCYTLFCKEYNKPFGVFRYRDQPAIETEPIEVGEEIIGFQSKFYEGNISSNHKNELVGTIEKAKRDYPNITKIIFYINSEFTKGVGGKEPISLKDTNKKANELGITIEWRLKSYFESPFVSIEQGPISTYFFENNSIIDVVFQKQKQTENILNVIHTDILFNNGKVEINRDNELNSITQKLKTNEVILIHGDSGVGKTALIKKLYELKRNIPFYIFNARDLNISNINELTDNYSFYDFINISSNEHEKIIVIDSAEKLLDIIDNTSLIEFLSTIIKSNWKVIITIRNSYLEDLEEILVDTYRVPFYPISLGKVTDEQLLLVSKEKEFSLPDNEKILELIKKPFYLNEYLKCYKSEQISSFVLFKETLWNNVIKKGDVNREKAFLEISINRAITGQFYISETKFKDNMDELVKEGVLGDETKGYFIAHDIYEEWALEKFINDHFDKRDNNKYFLDSIGNSLPIRRSFRNWISEKLSLNEEDIKTFIEDTIDSKELDSFWKDEILVAVLLSEYSDSFFEYFDKDLLNDSKFKLLKKISFLLRLACKQSDKNIFENIGLKKKLPSIFNNIFVEPKGNGWCSTIKFIFNNIAKIDYKNINFVLPIIAEWNNKNKIGETTRFASLIALNYYNSILKEKYYGKAPSTLIETILFGASEIKKEIEEVFNEVIKKKYRKHNDPYYDLCKSILTQIAYKDISQISTKYVLELADLFWYKPKKKKGGYRYEDIEEEYSLVDEHEFNYFPSSAIQTPIFWCLNADLTLTLDFIINFINKTIKSYAKNIEKVKLSLKNLEVEQIHNSTLWGMYRGMNTSPYLLQSILMALEMYLLNKSKILEQKELEGLLSYLLTKAETSAITSVVASIVVAYPEKTFNIAFELFKVKAFLECDFNRSTAEYTNNIDMSYDSMSKVHSLYRESESARIHRKESLSSIMFKCQLSVDKYKDKKQLIENIIDSFYKKIEQEPNENKAWKLFITNQIDLRNMNIKEELTNDNQKIISFEPKLDEASKKYKESVLENINDSNKYIELSLWSSYKLDNDNRHKKYDKYSSNIPLLIKSIKDILKSSDILNEEIPIECACILLRDYSDSVREEEKVLCKEILIDHIFNKRATHKIEKYISIFPRLMKLFPEEKDAQKIKLLELLRLGYGKGTFISMWETDYKNMYSLVIVYLILEPLYDIKYDEHRHRQYENVYREFSRSNIWNDVLKENTETIKKFYDNKLVHEDISNFESIDIDVLTKAFNIFPEINKTIEIKNFSYKLSDALANKILLDTDDKIGFQDSDSFCLNISYIMLNSKFDEIDIYLKPILNNFKSCKLISTLLDALINTQKNINRYEKFWYIWEKFKEPIIYLCKRGDRCGYIDKIIQSYLFASYNLGRNIFHSDVKEWHTLKDKNRKFFIDISKSIGHCVTTLDSLSIILNGVASNYLNDGILWLSSILQHNDLKEEKLGVNTIYNLEILVRKYIYKNQLKTKQIRNIKDSLLVILDFLIERGSSRAYMLRERIL